MVSPPPSVIYLLYVGAFTLAALSCFVSLTRLQRISDSDTRRGLAALLLTSGGWATTHVGFLVSPLKRLKLGWYVLGLVLGLATVGAWLYVCSAYTNRTYHQNPTYRRLAVAVFAILVAVKVTNPLHHGYFTTTSVASPFPHLSISTGSLHLVAMGLSYALAFVGYFMLLELFTKINFDTRPLLVLVGITGLPVVADLVGYTTSILIDITYEPLGVAVFAVGVTFVYVDRFDDIQLAAERDAPLITLDSDRNIRSANQAAKTLFPTITSAENTSLDAALPKVAERLGSDDPILAVEQNGETRYFQLTETPYGIAKSELGSTLVFTDVTDRERYRAELQRKNERLDEFTSVVSHDLRNPLRVASGHLERAQIDHENEHIAHVERALDRMDVLIEDLLRLAREGESIGDLQRVELADLVADCWQSVATAEATLTIHTEQTIKADRSRLQQLLENLIRNAVEHGGDDVTITIGDLDTGFYVEDDGPGISEGDRDSIFDTGYSTTIDGNGFGLRIVKEVSDAHGWDIRVTDGTSGGARFEIQTTVGEQSARSANPDRKSTPTQPD